MKKVLSILIISILVAGVVTPALQNSYADTIRPKFQSKIGIPTEDIVCDSGLFKVIRSGSDSAACVKPTSVSKLVNSGWAKDVDEKTLNDSINRKSIELAKINILEIVPVKADVGKLASSAPASSYNVVFEICALISIYAPDVLITTDSETKSYELVELIEPNTCIISAANLKASDSKSFKITLQNKGDISEKVITLQNQLDSLKSQLQLLSSSLKSETIPNNAQKQAKEIIDIRNQINDTREELYRLLFTIHAPQSSKQNIEKMTFSGKVIEGETATILSILDIPLSPDFYHVVFEACAGSSIVRLPIITVASDSETKSVKLGSKISPNSCQMTSAMIEADDKSTISVSPTGNANSSIKASDLEAQITTLQNSLVKEKQTLQSLIHNTERSANFTELVDVQVIKIKELRDQITVAKAEFSKIMYMTYK